MTLRHLVRAFVLILSTSEMAGAAERPAVDGWPGFAVGRLNVRGGGFCTATLISETQALTAARCLRDPSGRWYPAGRLMVELAPHRDGRKGYAPVRSYRAAPGLAFGPDGQPDDPARDWAVLELGNGGVRDGRIRPVPLAPPSERDRLGPDSLFTLVAFTPQRPYVATMAEGCRYRQIRGEPRILLHDCAATASIAGAPVFLDTEEGTVLVGIQVGSGLLDGAPVGVAALLERTIEPDTLLEGRAAAP